ncbi:MAG: MopE-related protein, partial [Patescibacteria group bacterium]|nr:MopE-related protein [Patescibacteria group bacterium]
TVTSATGTDPQIVFRTGATPVTQALIGIDYSDSNKLKLVRGSDIATSTGITIDSSGNVGIGTTTVGSRLTIQSSGTASTTSALNIQDSAGTSLVYVRDDGKVGIGTTSPQTLLQVWGTTTAQVILPQTDNTYDLGASGQRWANLYAATTTVGDLVFANQFRITEATTSPNSLIFLNQKGEKIAELDEQGNFTTKGNFAKLEGKEELTIKETEQGKIVELLPEDLRTGLASLGLLVTENGVLEVGELKVRQGITLYDKITGEPYCVFVEAGEIKTEKGECTENLKSQISNLKTTTQNSNLEDTGAAEDDCNTVYYYDSDGDGFGYYGNFQEVCEPPSEQWVIDNTDCDDSNAKIYPGAKEVCDNFKDDDCDGKEDKYDDDCQEPAESENIQAGSPQSESLGEETTTTEEVITEATTTKEEISTEEPASSTKITTFTEEQIVTSKNLNKKCLKKS